MDNNQYHLSNYNLPLLGSKNFTIGQLQLSTISASYCFPASSRRRIYIWRYYGLLWHSSQQIHIHIHSVTFIYCFVCCHPFLYFAKMHKCHDGEETRRAPNGQFVVYVGEQLKRFTLPLSYLKNPIFQQLLQKSAEEYGFSRQRSIVLPCDESTFERVIRAMAKSWCKYVDFLRWGRLRSNILLFYLAIGDLMYNCIK